MAVVAIATTPAPRFEPVVVNEWPTVRDNKRRKVIVHNGRWTEEFAERVAAELEKAVLESNPIPMRVLNWEDA